MLTLTQLQLIERVEHFTKSPFLFSLLDEEGAEQVIYIASAAEYIDWLTIPSESINHLSHIKVQVFQPLTAHDRVKASLAVYSNLSSSEQTNLRIATLYAGAKLFNMFKKASGEVVTPPLCAGKPS